MPTIGAAKDDAAWQKNPPAIEVDAEFSPAFAPDSEALTLSGEGCCNAIFWM